MFHSKFWIPKFFVCLLLLSFPAQTEAVNLNITAEVVKCQDGVKNGDEECDTNDFGGASCSSEGFYSGFLSCNPDCTINTSQCFVSPTQSSSGYLIPKSPPQPNPDQEVPDTPDQPDDCSLLNPFYYLQCVFKDPVVSPKPPSSGFLPEEVTPVAPVDPDQTAPGALDDSSEPVQNFSQGLVYYATESLLLFYLILLIVLVIVTHKKLDTR